jgi:hypothetical protein
MKIQFKYEDGKVEIKRIESGTEYPFSEAGLSMRFAEIYFPIKEVFEEKIAKIPNLKSKLELELSLER